jgi:hypothetical protein
MEDVRHHKSRLDTVRIKGGPDPPRGAVNQRSDHAPEKRRPVPGTGHTSETAEKQGSDGPNTKLHILSLVQEPGPSLAGFGFRFIQPFLRPSWSPDFLRGPFEKVMIPESELCPRSGPSFGRFRGPDFARVPRPGIVEDLVRFLAGTGVLTAIIDHYRSVPTFGRFQACRAFCWVAGCRVAGPGPSHRVRDTLALLSFGTVWGEIVSGNQLSALISVRFLRTE